MFFKYTRKSYKGLNHCKWSSMHAWLDFSSIGFRFGIWIEYRILGICFVWPCKKMAGHKKINNKWRTHPICLWSVALTPNSCWEELSPAWSLRNMKKWNANHKLNPDPYWGSLVIGWYFLYSLVLCALLPIGIWDLGQTFRWLNN